MANRIIPIVSICIFAIIIRSTSTSSINTMYKPISSLAAIVKFVRVFCISSIIFNQNFIIFTIICESQANLSRRIISSSCSLYSIISSPIAIASLTTITICSTYSICSTIVARIFFITACICTTSLLTLTISCFKGKSFKV